jgi:hypothetical protein
MGIDIVAQAKLLIFCFFCFLDCQIRIKMEAVWIRAIIQYPQSKGVSKLRTVLFFYLNHNLASLILSQAIIHKDYTF